ncbi:MAG TPA: peptidoglycan-binding protein [Candidatus Angelobacter sp.]
MASTGQSPVFPGHVIGTGSPDKASVTAIQKRLNQVGCGPIDEDGVFGAQTEEAVQLFQTRFPDSRGNPLTADGRVGPMTWAALFATAPASSIQPGTNLQQKVLDFASTQLQVREQPPGSNRGPEVDEYLRSVGIDPATGSFAWCAAFVYFCFQQASTGLGVKNPAIKDAGVLDSWRLAGIKGVHRIAASEAADTPSLVKPGMVFVIDSGGGHGHMGLIKQVDGDVLTTIEGNTNLGGSREGIGVFERVGRRISHINLGYLDYV